MLHFHKQSDYKKMLFHKLIANSTINPLTAIWQVENGELLKRPAYLRILKVLVAEIEMVLGLENQFEYVAEICQATAKNFSSMALDISKHRSTESDSIIKPILEIAAEKNIDVPLLTLIYEKIIYLEGKL